MMMFLGSTECEWILVTHCPLSFSFLSSLPLSLFILKPFCHLILSQDVFSRLNFLTFIPCLDQSGQPITVYNKVFGNPTLACGGSFLSKESKCIKGRTYLAYCNTLLRSSPLRSACIHIHYTPEMRSPLY